MNEEKTIQLSERFKLKRDLYNMWIEELAVSKKTGKETWTRVTGYYHTYAQLAESFCERRFRTADARDAQDFIRKCMKIEAEAKALCEKLLSC